MVGLMSHYAWPCGLHLKITFQIPAREEEWRGVGRVLTAVDPRAANKRECLIPAILIMYREHKGIIDFGGKKKAVLAEQCSKVQGKTTVSHAGLKVHYGGGV